MRAKFNQSWNSSAARSIALGLILAPLALLALFFALPILLVILGVFVIAILLTAFRLNNLKKSAEWKRFYREPNEKQNQDENKRADNTDAIDVEYKDIPEKTPQKKRDS